MRKVFQKLLLVCAVLSVGLFSACNEKVEDPADCNCAQVELASVDMNTATLKVTTGGITEYAYLVYKSDEVPETVPTAAILFHDGVTGECIDGDNMVVIYNLDPLTNYVAYVAAKTAEDFLETVFTVEISTTDTSEDFSLLSTYHDGYKVQLKMPADVKEHGNVLRYTYSSLPAYNALKMGWFSQADFELLQFNSGQIFGAEGETVLNLTVSDDNIYAKDENGNDIIDEWTGEPLMLHTPVVPGEPTVFIAGEFTHTQDPEELDWYGDWFTPLFDIDTYYGGGDGGDIMWVAPRSVLPTESLVIEGEDQYWTGFHMRKTWVGPAPKKLDAKLNLKVKDVTALNATITITPDEGISQYSLFIVDEDTYQTAVLPMLDNDESLMQWFSTSYYGFQNGAMMYEDAEPREINLSDVYYSDAEVSYRVFAVGISDNTLKEQCFETATFTTLAKSHPVPEVVVTAIDAPKGNEKTPFEVWFNIKCPSKNAVSGKYAANYIDPWVKENNKYTPNSDLIANMGNALSDEEIKQINSNDGYNVMFSTLEGMTTRLGVMLYNDEETANDPDVEGSTAIADATSGYLPDAAEVASPLFASLNGEWTMQAQAVAFDWEAYAWVETAETVTTKVTISNGVTYPATLSDEVYAVYEENGMNKEETDRAFESFKADADAYNARLRGQNRLLLLGFNSAFAEYDSKTMSAFEAFYSNEYNCFDNATLLHDFGPKWYLEIDGEGNVTAPFNSARFAPMSNWYAYPMYLAAINTMDEGYMVGYDNEMNPVATMHFPVTVSEDGNTITVKAIVEEGSEFYPNVAYNSWSGTSIMGPKYVSELTLTKGWNGDAVETSRAKASSKSAAVKANVPADTKFANLSMQKSRTSFLNPVHYKKETYRIVRTEEMKENFIKMVKSKKRK